MTEVYTIRGQEDVIEEGQFARWKQMRKSISTGN
jgi:hypothetical protein